jgi:hypothetical protein
MQADVKSRFDYVEWDNFAEFKAKQILTQIEGVAAAIDFHLCNSREKSLALTALEECFMWMHRAVRSDQIIRSMREAGE